jgi:tetratricopeptide (TPR) repeat protein
LGILLPGALDRGDPDDRDARFKKPEAVGLPQLQPPPAEGAKLDDPLFQRRAPQDREKLPEPVPPRRKKQEPNPADEVTGLVTRGLKAFARGEYARAERCFLLAGQVAPDEAVSFFFLAQAQFAMGKYQESVENIQAGLRLDPHWPLSPFQPGKLYEGEPGEFTEQLQHLAEILGRFPVDPFLLFLMGYQLWFDGKQDEARQWFGRAAALAPDKTFFNLFLNAKPKVSKAGS